MPPMNTLREPGAAHCKQNSRQPKHREPHSVKLLNPRAAFASQAGHHAESNSAGSQQPRGAVGVPSQVGSNPELCHGEHPPPPLAVPLLGTASLGALGKQTRQKEPLCSCPKCCEAGAVLSGGAWLAPGHGHQHWQQPLCSCLPRLSARRTDSLGSSCQGAAPSWAVQVGAGAAHGILVAQELLLGHPASPGRAHPVLGTACVRGGRLKAKWCRIMGPSVSAGARHNSKKETHFFPFLSGFGWEPT